MTSECWEWKGAKNKGYGSVKRNGKSWLVHRWIVTILNGPIQNGFDVHHICGNKPCIRPSHLGLIRHEDHGRKTYCKNGHRLAGDNLYFSSRGDRQCRACGREWHRRNYKRTTLETHGSD